MKKISLILAVLGFASVFAAPQPGPMGSAFQDLSRDDQVEFVRAVNKSMTDYKTSTPEKRLTTIYAINRDAVRGAPEKQRKAVIAEVFATAPFDALPMITERFASEIFNRKAAGFNDKDDSFTEFMSATLMQVRNRLFKATPVEERPGARSAFAMISFLKASEGKPADLQDSLLFFILTGSQELAREVWIPEAMGADGKPPSYESILNAGYEGEEPAHVRRHSLAQMELGNLMAGSDLRLVSGGKAKDTSGPRPIDIPTAAQGMGELGQGLNRVPRPAMTDPSAPWYYTRRDGEGYMGQGL